MQDRIKRFDGVINFRDFGGYRTADGGQIKPGLLFRSANFATASAADIEQLDGMNIAYQVDLRRPDERERDVARWTAKTVKTSDKSRLQRAPHMEALSRVDAEAGDAEGYMIGYYAEAPFRDSLVELYTDWFDTLAGLPGDAPVVVNCTAGKDRTGLICALTKLALGATRDDVMADYLLTNTAADVDRRLPDFAARINARHGLNHAPEVYHPVLGVRAQYLEKAFAVIESEAGGVDAYLNDVLGVDAEKRAALTARLVA